MKILKHVTKKEEIKKLPRDIGSGQFNNCEHLFVQLEPGQWQTISVRLNDGKHITFSFCPSESSANGFECVDIHSTVAENGLNRNGEKKWKHHVLGFDAGGTPLDSRKIPAPIALLSVLLADKHYQ